MKGTRKVDLYIEKSLSNPNSYSKGGQNGYNKRKTRKRIFKQCD